MPNIQLQSEDGVLIEVDIEVAKISHTIKTMMEIMEPEDGDVVPVATIPGWVLRKMVEWLNHHKDDVLPVEYSSSPVKIEGWDAEFFNVSAPTVLRYITAAHYLDIKGLVNLGTSKAASIIAGKSPEEIRRMFSGH